MENYYNLEYIGRLQKGITSSPLYKVNIDGQYYYATVYNDYISLGPPVLPPKPPEPVPGIIKFTVNGKIIIEDSTRYIAYYGDILDWAGYNPTTTIPYTVTFRDKTGGGELCRGDRIELTEGMVFNVAYTGNA